MLGGWDGASGAREVSVSQEGLLAARHCCCVTDRGHPSARSSGPQQHGRVLLELLPARMVLVLRYNQLHGISTGGEGNFIWKQIGIELVGNE